MAVNRGKKHTPITRNLNIAYWNANGIFKQKSIFQHFIEEQQTDIALLNETHLKQYHHWTFRNYTIIRTDRQTEAKGGTAIVIRNSIPFEPVILPPLQHIEATAIKLLTPQNPIHLVAVYKKPELPLIRPDLDVLQNLGPRVLLAGDLNSKHPAWNSRRRNKNGDRLYAYLPALKFQPYAPKEPTHFPINGGAPDILDIALSTEVDLLEDPRSINALQSDHNPVVFPIDHRHTIPQARTNKIPITDWPQYKQHLLDELPQLPTPTNIQETEDAIDSLTALLLTAYKANTTYIQPEKKPGDPAARTAALIQLKRWARKKWQQTRHPGYKTLFNKLTQKVKTRIARLKQEEWDTKLQQVDAPSNEFWKIARNLRKTPHRTNRPLHGPQGLKFDPDDKAEIFANYLQDIFTPHPEVYNEETVQQTHRQLRTIIAQDPQTEPDATSPREVERIVSKLPMNKAPGVDRITSMMLKQGPRRLNVYLAQMYNKLLQLAHFPSNWKHASICMIPKPGTDQMFPQNYRPISLLSVLSKVYERIVKTRLQEFVEEHKLYPDHQFGFRPEHDTTAQLVRVVDHIAVGFNAMQHTVGVFLDIEKAFDRVWHPGLIVKLNQLHFPDCYVHLLHNFLQNRTFTVRSSGTTSESHPITAGVPQGSVLSPLLYVIYTADLPIARACTIATFADDTALFSSNKNIRYAAQAIQRQLLLLEQWSNTWRIKVNPAKSQAIIFSRRRPAPHNHSN